MRPLWKGLVTFGLVSFPVGLYSATRRQAELHFRLLHEKDQAPIDYRRFCTEEDVEVDWKDIVKGYEYEKGRFVVVTDEDFERAGVAGTHTIEIRDFVPAGDIDFAYFETLAGPFKPEQYHDAYTEALRAVIEAKIEGKEVSVPKTSRPPRVVSLVDALRKSLAAPRAAGQAKTAVRKRARRREKKAA